MKGELDAEDDVRSLAAGITAIFAVLTLSACAPGAAAQGQDTQITMSRSVCYGFCPDYTVTISGDGSVTYVGRAFVHVVGERRASIPPADVANLLRRFDEIGFERLNDAYRANVSDHPTTIVVLERGGRRKVVVDYAGLNAGMPAAVRELQDEIDAVAGTAQWVLRDGEPVRTRPQP